jgi:hypothetical protein
MAAEKPNRIEAVGLCKAPLGLILSTAGLLHVSNLDSGLVSNEAWMALFGAVMVANAPSSARLAVEGVRSMLEARNGKEYRSRAQANADICRDILRAIQRPNGKCDLLAVSLRDILHTRGLLPRLRQEFSQSAASFKMRMAILDPDCVEAARRAGKEHPYKETIDDIRRSKENYENIISLDRRVTMGLYSIRPFRFICLTDDVVYIQDYLNSPPKDWNGLCFGDLQKVRRFRPGSFEYSAAEGEVDDLFGDPAFRWVIPANLSVESQDEVPLIASTAVGHGEDRSGL